MLTRDAQRNAAADQHPQPRTSLEELRRDCGGFEHLLEVVEHEQRLFFPEVLEQCLDRPAAARGRDGKRLRDR